VTLKNLKAEIERARTRPAGDEARARTIAHAYIKLTVRGTKQALALRATIRAEYLNDVKVTC
jgi:hypothetical protein